VWGVVMGWKEAMRVVSNNNSNVAATVGEASRGGRLRSGCLRVIL